MVNDMTAIPVTTVMPGVFPDDHVHVLKASQRGLGLTFTLFRGVPVLSDPLATEISQRNALAILTTSGSGTRVTYDDAWASGRHCSIGSGDAIILDLRRPTTIQFNGGNELLRVDIPITTLRGFALEHGWQEMPEIATQFCGRHDPALSAMVASLVPYFEDARKGRMAVVDYVSMAVLAHLLAVYAVRDSIGIPKGRLAGWQERRARELIDDNLSGDLSITWLAGQCGLSVSYFARAFKESVGVPPYQWMIERRVQRAKELMHERSRSLSDVALSCGFADQSHFSRAFSRVTGVPPGVWRRTAYGTVGY